MRKGVSGNILRQIVFMIILLFILLAVLPMIVGGANSAAEAAKSCSGLAGKLANWFGTGVIC